ncbi:hypothetical protein CTI12_AA169410 [Artemisia annua]|uniref:Uncharacterized protein n=1 Tax=Artemisia annua TaxID=35608 RepID=A0A2U1PC92_ARTAN|nr:hypothetical protein CTI12_AA169410 [Artemisia annua]
MKETKKFKRLKKARADADGGHSGFSDEEENDGTGKGGRSAENNISRSLFIDDATWRNVQDALFNICQSIESFPRVRNARPRSTSRIQPLCSLHIALEKTKTFLQHCAERSKIYLAITGDSVVLKFEKARLALEDGLRRIEDIVPQIIGVSLTVKVLFVQGQEEKAEAWLEV